MIRNRGEAEARISSNLTGKQLEAQLGYQLSNHLVLHAAVLSFRRPKYGTCFGSVDFGLGYYYPLANERWRLGVHAGLAHGGGASGSDFCFDCNGPFVSYQVRYTYAYVQPTVLWLDGSRSWGLGLRLGQVYYNQLDEQRTEWSASGADTQSFDLAGHTFTFVQPTFQFSRRLRPRLALSGTLGIQAAISKRNALDLVNPLIAQVNLHLIIGRQPASNR